MRGRGSREGAEVETRVERGRVEGETAWAIGEEGEGGSFLCPLSDTVSDQQDRRVLQGRGKRRLGKRGHGRREDLERRADSERKGILGGGGSGTERGAAA
eukprot:1124087-Rhodomonas_salina.3